MVSTLPWSTGAVGDDILATTAFVVNLVIAGA